MRYTLERLLVFVAVVIVACFSLAAHTSAIPMGNHDMNGMSHSFSSSNCATLCANNAFHKDETFTIIREEKDDEPIVPHYLITRSFSCTYTDVEADGKLYHAIVKPLSKVPIYIRYLAFRV